MRAARRTLDRLAGEILGRRLAAAVDPLQRAQLKAAAGIRLDLWADDELQALAEHLAPEYTAQRRAEAEQRQAEIAERLAAMPLTELSRLFEQVYTSGERARDPGRYEQRRYMLDRLIDGE